MCGLKKKMVFCLNSPTEEILNHCMIRKLKKNKTPYSQVLNSASWPRPYEPSNEGYSEWHI